MAGPHHLDIVTLKPKLTLPDNFEDIKGSRIACSIGFGYQEVEPEVRDNTLAAVIEEVDSGSFINYKSTREKQ